jgi:hypothetical protein
MCKSLFLQNLEVFKLAVNRNSHRKKNDPSSTTMIGILLDVFRMLAYAFYLAKT